MHPHQRWDHLRLRRAYAMNTAGCGVATFRLYQASVRCLCIACQSRGIRRKVNRRRSTTDSVELPGTFTNSSSHAGKIMSGVSNMQVNCIDLSSSSAESSLNKLLRTPPAWNQASYCKMSSLRIKTGVLAALLIHLALLNSFAVTCCIFDKY
jgi:hypothetical protein